MLKILQWNLNGFYNNLTALELIMSFYKPLIIALQETHLSPSTSLKKFKNYNVLLENRPTNRSKGGIGILLHQSITYNELNINSNFLAQAVNITSPFNLTIINLYWEHSLKANIQDLKTLHLRTGNPILILGDFNAHNSLWGSIKTDNRGKLIEKWLEECNLVTLNTGQPTHISTYNSLSCIDLSIATPNMALKTTWYTHSSPQSSDHIPIILEVNVPTPIKKKIIKYIESHANWELFTSKINHFLTRHPISLNTNKEAATLTSSLKYSASHALKTADVNKGTKPPWLNRHIRELIKIKNRCWRKYKRCPDQVHFIDFKRASAIMKREIRKAKTESWKNFANSITPQTSMTENWKRAKAVIGNRILNFIPAIDQGSGPVVEPLSNANFLVQRSHEKGNDANFNVNFRESKQRFLSNLPWRGNSPGPNSIQTDYRAHSLGALISLKEMKTTLNSFKGTTPGLDGITYGMLKKTPEAYRTRLVKLYNGILSSGTFPHEWKLAELRPIPKNTPNDPNPSNWRMISLLKTQSKLFEKILGNRLSWFLEQKLHNSIHGFRPNRSTTTLLLALNQHLAEALSKRKHTLLLSVDLDKAFDRVGVHCVIQQLQNWGCNQNFNQAIFSFLSNRRIAVRFNGFLSDIKTLQNGLPQGSPLSVHLFNVITASLATALDKLVNTKFLIYADNILIYSTGTPNAVNKRLTNALKVIQKWAEEMGAGISLDKLEAIHICRKKNCCVPTLLFYNSNIPIRNTLKILGLTITKNLSWEEHIKEVEGKLKRRNNLLKVICGTKAGPHPNTAANIGKTILLGCAEYALSIYGFSPDYKLKRIQTQINTGARLALGALRTSPIDALLTESGFPRIQDRRDKISLNLLHKNLTNPSQPLHNIACSISDTKDTPRFPSALHRSWSTSLRYGLVKTPPVPQEISAPPWLFPSEMVDISLATLPKNCTPTELYRQLHKEKINYISHLGHNIWYTDASVNEGCAAFAVVTETRILTKKQLPYWFSAGASELSAIWEAMNITKDFEQTTHIFTDSLASLRSILNTKNKNVLQTIIRNTLQTAKGKIILHWCPAHVGIEGNERADEEAKNATEEPLVLSFPPHQAAMKNHIKHRIEEKVQDRWDRSTSFLRKHKPTSSPTIFNAEIRRWIAVKIIRVRLGHTLITKKHLFNKTAPPSCRHCNEPLSMRHIFLECQSSPCFAQNPLTLLDTSSLSLNKLIDFLLEHGITLGEI